jgi:hypothetical protein
LLFPALEKIIRYFAILSRCIGICHIHLFTSNSFNTIRETYNQK